MQPRTKAIVMIIIVLSGAVLLSFIAFLVYMTIKDYKPGDTELLQIEGKTAKTELSHQQEISLVAWNIGYAGLGREMDFFYDGGRQVRPDSILQQKYFDGITEQLGKMRDYDFVMLLEVDRYSKRSYYHDQWEAIKKIFNSHASVFAWNYRVLFVPMPLYEPMGKVMAGMGTLSSFFPTIAERHSLHRDDPWPTGLFTLDRCFILTRYAVEGGKELVLINTHNSAFDDGSLRKRQMALLRNTILNEYEKGNFVIAAGDWNLNPPLRFHEKIITGDWIEYIEPPIDKDFLPGGWSWGVDQRVPSNRWATEEYLKGRTWTTIIDFFVLSPNIELLNIETLDLTFENSDHNPVTVRVRLK